MFRRGSLEDEELVLVANVAHKYEADQLQSVLEQAGIPALLADREDAGSYLRILGYGSPFGVDVLVNRMHASRARALVEEILSEAEDISEEELAQLALEAGDQ